MTSENNYCKKKKCRAAFEQHKGRAITAMTEELCKRYHVLHLDVLSRSSHGFFPGAFLLGRGEAGA